MRQKLLLLIAVIFGILAFVLTYQQLEAEKRRIQGDVEKVVLIKMVRNMVEGEVLTENDIARFETNRPRQTQALSRDIPWSQAPRVIGRKLETSMTANQILQSTDLKPISQRQGFNGIIQPGLRAVSIPVDAISSVNNLIQPNDNVDVIGTFRFPDVRGEATLDTLTMTILQDVKVLAVGNRWGAYSIEPNGARAYGTVTLQVYPDEVEMLVFAAQKGKLTLALRNYDDERISRDIEKRSVNFKMLEKAIPEYNQRREKRHGVR